jgi:hypothetical protein
MLEERKLLTKKIIFRSDPQSTAAAFDDAFLGAASSGPVTGALAGWRLAIDNTVLIRDPGDFDDLATHAADVWDYVKREVNSFEQVRQSFTAFHFLISSM